MGTMYEREMERNQVFSVVSRSSRENRERLIAEYKRRSEGAFAPQTLRNYRLIVRQFRTWCVDNDHDPEPPVSPSIVAEWVESMGGKLAATTIETRLWGIAELHRSMFLVPPCRHRLVELALKRVKRKFGGGRRQAVALGKAEVLGAIGRLGTSRKDLRDKALLWIATDSWCRASEIVAFKVRDLLRQDDGSSLLFLERSKTDPNGMGAYAYLSPRGAKAVMQWIQLAELKDADPILTKSQPGGKKAPLDPSTVSRIMKRCTGRKDVSSHSTRVGGVQDAFRLGCDLSSIMVAGRWASAEMPARYGRKILASQSAAAQVSRAFEDDDAAEDSL
ncbi:tyrosine-type recombinase/integrase [Mesobacterium pallidum]|uniref:tyrosine-type recombinase/integrase n=1 Tax=Mesobacterium pallidum TaxID=2872037 RepID=UPI001EE2DCB1|nr:tyrosine-type recombinase/integrase [Mesobacterium pallidum]